MNMKKLLAILMAALLACALMSCSKDKDDEEDDALNKVDDVMVYGDFTYDVNGEGTYEITGYTYVGVEPVDVVIPAEIDGREVTGIGDDVFKALKTVKSVTIPDSITYIGQFAFNDCDAIKSITLPNSVVEVGVGAFWGCDALEEVTLSESLSEIADYMFKECKALAEITIPESVESIGEAAFWYCEALTEVTVPTGVKDMGEMAFYGCASLSKATVLGTALGATEIDEEENETAHVIGDMVFHSCAADLEVVVTENSEFAKYAEENHYNVTFANDEAAKG